MRPDDPNPRGLLDLPAYPAGPQEMQPDDPDRGGVPSWVSPGLAPLAVFALGIQYFAFWFVKHRVAPQRFPSYADFVYGQIGACILGILGLLVAAVLLALGVRPRWLLGCGIMLNAILAGFICLPLLYW